MALYSAAAVLLGRRLWGIDNTPVIKDLRLLKGILGLVIGQGCFFCGTTMGRVCLVVEECRKQRRRKKRNRLAREAAQKERKWSEVTVGGASTTEELDWDGGLPELPV